MNSTKIHHFNFSNYLQQQDFLTEILCIDLSNITGFKQTVQDVTFDIICISIYLTSYRLYYCFNKWLKQSQMAAVTTQTLEIV